jgi:hypothetical protein
MLPFGVTISATVPQGSEIPEGLMNNPVLKIQTNTKLDKYFSYRLNAVHLLLISKLLLQTKMTHSNRSLSAKTDRCSDEM